MSSYAICVIHIRSTSLKFSIVWCLSNAVVKVHHNTGAQKKKGGRGWEGATPSTILWGWHFSNKKIIKIPSINQRSSNPQKESLEVLWKKGVLENSCSEIKKNVPDDHSHKTIFSLMFTDIDITSSTQGCLKQA